MLRDTDRTALCLMGALCLHGSATLLGSCDDRHRASETRAALAPLLLDVAIEMPPPGPGSAPGGGSPEPDPNGARAAVVPQPPSRSVEIAARAARVEEHPAVRDEVARDPDPEATSEPVSNVLASAESAADLLAAPAPKLRPMRVFDQLQRPSATAPDVATGDDPSRAEGSGPGANRGPGGRGSGLGNGRGGSPFGGASGAFRADVCFIPKDTKNLKELNGVCPPVLTLFTDVLDVPPRSFTDGFPGVSDRFEWFAVFYRGKFTVRASNYYRFRVLSDDGAIVYIDGYRIIDNDGQHAPQSKQMTIPLEAGEHELHLQYYQGHREIIALQLFVRPDGGEERLFSPEL